MNLKRVSTPKIKKKKPTKKIWTIYSPEELYLAAQKKAERENRSFSGYVRNLIEKDINPKKD